MDEGVEIEPTVDLAAQHAPDFNVDQRINEWQVPPAITNRFGVALLPL